MERGVSKKIVHPKYNFFTYEYDLALVKLETPLEFTDHIAPICLPGTEDLLVGANATVTGWGRLSEGGTLPTVLQEVRGTIVEETSIPSRLLLITLFVICAPSPPGVCSYRQQRQM